MTSTSESFVVRESRRAVQRLVWYGRDSVSWLSGRKRAVRKVKEGFRMRINRDDFMDREFRCGKYAENLVSLIRKVVQRGDTTVDIGSHKGYVAMCLAQQVGPEGTVLAVEPDPLAFAELAENRRRNAFQQIRLFNHAVGRESGTARFAMSHQLGWTSRYPNEIAAPAIRGYADIPILTGDSLLSGAEICMSNLSFIKIDAEGSEEDILRGMMTTLNESGAILWIEINKLSLQKAGSSPENLFGLLEAQRYALFLPEGDAFRPALGSKLLEEPLFDIIAVKQTSRCAHLFPFHSAILDR